MSGAGVCSESSTHHVVRPAQLPILLFRHWSCGAVDSPPEIMQANEARRDGFGLAVPAGLAVTVDVDEAAGHVLRWLDQHLGSS
jgi:hypothetical protein